MHSFPWRLLLRVITVLSWVLAIPWFVAEPGYEPLIAVVAGIGTLLGSFAASDTPITEYRPTLEQRLRNRRAMLELVRSFWVEGVLEQSLHNAAMIELGMDLKPDAVEHPWDMVLQTDREDRTLPPGTKIIDVLDEISRNLLILGEPGSGKTTMLLELARDTIARVEEDPTQPIPVVFNLSSWTDKQQRFAEWLVDELNTKYNIPRKVAQPWVECDELLLLLDGLDEVALKCRDDCVKAINEFRQDHLVPLVVCSRVADYEALTVRLRLQGAVLLQPLTLHQIDEYLAGAGIALSAVRETLQHDPTLQELAETPLMLSIMTLAYQGVSVEDLQALDTVEARHQHLFGTYVRRMFERRGADQPYSPRQTIRWLAWLAKTMSKHAQSVFLVERIQPYWLLASAQRQVRIVAMLVFGLVFGLVGGLVFGLVGGLGFGLVGGLDFGLVGGLVFGLGGGLGFGLVLGLAFGGEAVIKHLILRYLLWRKGYLPWNLVRFLDYAAERIFLRKVGGGYIFIHRLLQDHFASLYQDQ